MSAFDYNTLKEHIGHKIVCVGYGPPGKEPANVAVECEDCCEVLLDYDRPIEDLEEGECPEGGDPANDCSGCAYSGDYHLVGKQCVLREE